MSYSVWLGKSSRGSLHHGLPPGEDAQGERLNPEHTRADARVPPVPQGVCINLLESALALEKKRHTYVGLFSGACSFGHGGILGEISCAAGSNAGNAKTPNCVSGFRTCWNYEVSDSDTHGRSQPFVPKVLFSGEHY